MIGAIMEKLIELLNEYDKEEGLWNKWEEDEQGLNNMWKIYDYHSKLKIISKEYGFIEWLVENDKIDVKKVKKEFYNNICITEYGDEDRIMGDDNLVIAVLSIQDNPIEFLISILR